MMAKKLSSENWGDAKLTPFWMQFKKDKENAAEPEAKGRKIRGKEIVRGDEPSPPLHRRKAEAQNSKAYRKVHEKNFCD
jgi:hypothetical protein